MSTENLPPAQLAQFDQLWQNVNHTLDNLLASYRNLTGDGEMGREVDLVLFVSALTETMEAHTLGELLACAVARLAEVTA